jgi:hypothetical protein
MARVLLVEPEQVALESGETFYGGFPMQPESAGEESRWDEVLAAIFGDVDDAAMDDIDIDVDVSEIENSEVGHARESNAARGEKSQAPGR